MTPHRQLFPLSLLIAMLLALLNSNIAVAVGPTCTVGDPGYPTIQTAVNDLTCITITVPADTYFEHVVIDHNLSIEGAGADTTTVNGGGIGSVFHITDSVVSLSGLTITGGAGSDIFNVEPVWGGGIVNYQGNVTLANVTVSGNSAHNGAGMYNYEGDLSIVNSTVSSNTASLYGGGINNWGTVTVTNSSFSHNSGGFGGGIFSQNDVVLIQSTLNDNGANTGGGGVYAFGEGTLAMSNTIIANSPSGGDCMIDTPAVLIDGGYNLVEDGSCVSGGTNLSGDPLLGPLANNGGPTLTHALLPGSPALHKIPNAINGCGTTLINDQRGLSRPSPAEGSCDIGAVEMQFVDTDKDGSPDGVDNCPNVANVDQVNTDGDDAGNACDTDDDNDGVVDTSDAFPLDKNESADTDHDGIGDKTDNCPAVANNNQADSNHDGIGDACTPSEGGENPQFFLPYLEH